MRQCKQVLNMASAIQTNALVSSRQNRLAQYFINKSRANVTAWNLVPYSFRQSLPAVFPPNQPTARTCYHVMLT